MSDSEPTSELDWTAFCYAAGELSAAEAEAFEARLAEDQPAREALARAVELTQTVAAAEVQVGDIITPARWVRSDWNTRLSWMAIGGLASLLLALLWSGVVGPTWHNAQRNFRAKEQQQLAWIWNETRTEIANVREAGLWPSVPTASAEADDEWTGDAGEGSLEEAPSWMLAALYGQADDGSQPDEPVQRVEN